MTVSVEGFKARFPTLGGERNDVIQVLLDDQVLQHDPDVWGTLLDLGVYYATAHVMALGPKGMTGRLVAPGKSEADPLRAGTTSYKIVWTSLLNQVSCGAIVL